MFSKNLVQIYYFDILSIVIESTLSWIGLLTYAVNNYIFKITMNDHIFYHKYVQIQVTLLIIFVNLTS